jgi:polysaccharide export outer membrane protein
MEDRDARSIDQPVRAHRALVTGLAAVATLASLTGCHWDSYLDPSVVGRWENTPAIVPILENIAEIEEQTGQFTEYTEVQPEDLLPEPSDYEIAAGDVLTLQLWDLVIRGQPLVETKTVDATGAVDILQLGRVEISGLNEQQAADRIAQRMASFVADPLVSVTIESRREQAFQLSGAVAQPGSFAIPSGDYRLLQALVTAGGISESVPYLYVIRQVSLADIDPARPDVVPQRAPSTNQGGSTAPGQGSAPTRPNTDDSDVDDLIDIIEDLSGDGGSPAAFGARFGSAQPARRDDAGAPDPIIDLPDDNGAPVNANAGSPADAAGGDGATRWVFLNGRWVRTAATQNRPTAPGSVAQREAAADPLADAVDALLTQRIIRVPVTPLFQGDARYNIVVRPGDVIRVPLPASGNVYLGGQVARPGVYALPQVGRLTLTRAIVAGGGLGQLAIPERVDLTRMIGPDRQATIMLNYRAIAEGTQPDVFLKRDDVVNVGTNFWAFPLAVIRGGFRASYGFGFLLDRNFGNDVFGAPPTNFRN